MKYEPASWGSAWFFILVLVMSTLLGVTAGKEMK